MVQVIDIWYSYNLVYGNLLSIPTEISAICVLFQYWTDINQSVWIIVTIILTVTVGFSAIRIYGEVEFWFALLKILFIIFLIILGLIIDLGGVPGTPRIGFRYWKDPGPFVEYIATGSWGKFLGFWTVMCKFNRKDNAVLKANTQKSQCSLQLRRSREHRHGRRRNKEPAPLYPTSMQESIRPSLHLLRPRSPDRGNARAKRRRETRR
jgi:L-asparagine transporter-like permease